MNMNKTIGIIFAMIGIAIALVFLLPTASADTHTLATGDNDLSTVIAAASSGDTIVIGAGDHTIGSDCYDSGKNLTWVGQSITSRIIHTDHNFYVAGNSSFSSINFSGGLNAVIMFNASVSFSQFIDCQFYQTSNYILYSDTTISGNFTRCNFYGGDWVRGFLSTNVEANFTDCNITTGMAFELSNNFIGTITGCRIIGYYAAISVSGFVSLDISNSLISVQSSSTVIYGYPLCLNMTNSSVLMRFDNGYAVFGQSSLNVNISDSSIISDAGAIRSNGDVSGNLVNCTISSTDSTIVANNVDTLTIARCNIESGLDGIAADNIFNLTVSNTIFTVDGDCISSTNNIENLSLVNSYIEVGSGAFSITTTNFNYSSLHNATLNGFYSTMCIYVSDHSQSVNMTGCVAYSAGSAIYCGDISWWNISGGSIIGDDYGIETGDFSNVTLSNVSEYNYLASASGLRSISFSHADNVTARDCLFMVSPSPSLGAFYGIDFHSFNLYRCEFPGSAIVGWSGDIGLYDCIFDLTSVAVRNGGSITVSGVRTGFYLYNDDSPPLAHATGTISWYGDFAIEIRQSMGYQVYINTTPSTIYASGATNQFGYFYANNTPVVYSYLGNTTYMVSAHVPMSWSVSDLNVFDRTTETAVESRSTTGQILWYCFPSSYYVSAGFEIPNIEVSNPDDNASMAVNITPNMDIETSAKITIVNSGPTIKLTAFRFTCYNWTGTRSNIAMNVYNLSIYRNGILLTKIPTSNGSVYWESNINYTDTLSFAFEFSVGTWVLNGNYSAVWVLSAYGTNEGSRALSDIVVTKTGIVTMTVSADPFLFLDITSGSEEIRYPILVEVLPGDSPYSVNQLSITAGSGAEIDCVQMEFGTMSDGLGHTIPMVRDSIRARLLLGDWVTNSRSIINFSYTGLADFIQGVQHLYEFNLLNIPSTTPAGTYTGTITVRLGAWGRGGEYAWTNAQVCNQIVVVGQIDTMATELSYTYTPRSPADSEAKALEFGTDVAPGSGVSSVSWIVITNTGNVNIDRIEVIMSNLMASGVSDIHLGGNAFLVYNDAEYPIEDGLINNYCNVTFATPVAPGGTYVLGVRIVLIPAETPSASYTGTFAITSIHVPASRVPAIFDLFDTVTGTVGVPGVVTTCTIQMTDGSQILKFTSPLTSGLEAENQLIFRNNGLMPLDAIIFRPSNSSPALYYITDGLGETYYPDSTGRIVVRYDDKLQIGKLQAFRFFVYSIAGAYDRSVNYTEQIVNITAEQSLYTEPPEILFVGVLNTSVVAVGSEFDLSTGLNYFTVSGTSFSSASEIIARGHIAWVATWDTAGREWVYYLATGQGIDFALQDGQGVVIFADPLASPIEVGGPVVSTASYSVPEGLSFKGNPTNRDLYVADLVQNTSSVLWVAHMTGDGTFEYYFPTMSVPNNFLVASYEAIWIMTDQNDTVSY